MSYQFINGRPVELLEPNFFEPKPVNKISFAYINYNSTIKRTPIIKRKSNINYRNIPSVLSKRKLVDAFGEKIYKDEYRYGQEIPADFFNTNIGHGVYIINK
jgi:hypothetical protein